MPIATVLHFYHSGSVVVLLAAKHGLIVSPAASAPAVEEERSVNKQLVPHQPTSSNLDTTKQAPQGKTKVFEKIGTSLKFV